MRSSMKYAALNIGVLLLGLMLVAFAGAGIEGGLSLPFAAGACLALAAAMRKMWREICRMEHMARQVRHTARTKAPAVREAPDLRVA